MYIDKDHILDLDGNHRESMDTSALDEAFKKSKYRWRTIRGLAKETHLPEEMVRAYCLHNRGKVFRSTYKNQKGEDLFTTKDLFYKYAPIHERILAALRNRID